MLVLQVGMVLDILPIYFIIFVHTQRCMGLCGHRPLSHLTHTKSATEVSNSILPSYIL